MFLCRFDLYFLDKKVYGKSFLFVIYVVITVVGKKSNVIIVFYMCIILIDEIDRIK